MKTENSAVSINKTQEEEKQTSIKGKSQGNVRWRSINSAAVVKAEGEQVAGHHNSTGGG